jgi:hypothetical protein
MRNYTPLSAPGNFESKLLSYFAICGHPSVDKTGFKALENVRRSRVDGLESKAHGIVTLKQRLSVEDSASQVCNVNASEGIWRAGIATNDSHVGKGFERTKGVDCEGCYAVVIANRATVPLVLALVMSRKAKVSWCSRSQGFSPVPPTTGSFPSLQ